MRIHLPILILLSVFFSSCKKDKNCAVSIKLSASSITPTVGDDIEIIATKESDDDVYQWYDHGLGRTTNSNKIIIDDIKLSSRGWYYCGKSNRSCNTVLIDSIFIDVKLKQETPPCSLTNNYINCSNIPSVNLTSVTQGFNGTFNTVGVDANGSLGYPSFTVLFNSYNGHTEPLDGTYISTDHPTFDVLQEPNEISVSFLYGSNYYHSQPGQKVYVTHVNGKIQISFCNIIFSSSPLPTTTCTGKMTEQ